MESVRQELRNQAILVETGYANLEKAMSMKEGN
jgi:hypothetical protein